MITLKEMNTTFKVVREICKQFNDSGLGETKIPLIGRTGEMMVVDLINAVDTISDDEMDKIPESVQDFYQQLPDEAFNTVVGLDELKAGTTEETPEPAPAKVVAKVVAKPKEKVTPIKPAAPAKPAAAVEKPKGKVPAKVSAKVSAPPKVSVPEPDADDSHAGACPSHGIGWSAVNAECLACNTDFPEENLSCKRAVRGVPAHNQKNLNSGAPKAKVVAMKSRYGHRVNTMAACIDDMIWHGAKAESIATKLVKWYGRSKPAAEAKIKSHVSYLVGARDIITTVAEDGTIKANKEFSAGQNAQNTAKATPSVIQEKTK